MTIQPGECAGPTLALDPRAGFLRCGPTGTALLDPCEVAPYDATLVGCLPDPTGSPVLLRLAGPAPTVDLGGAPPYRLLVLDGGDRCLPIPATEPTSVPPPAPTTTTTTTTGGGTSTDPPTSGRAPTSTSPTTGTSSSAPGRGSSHDDRHDPGGSRGRRGGHVGGDLHRDGHGHHHGRAEGEGPERGQGLHDVHLGADHDHGTDDDHPARRAADLRLRQRRHGHRPAGRLGPGGDGWPSARPAWRTSASTCARPSRPAGR